MNTSSGFHRRIPKNWETVAIKDVTSDWRGGAPFEREDFTEQGFPVLHKGAIQRNGQVVIDPKKKTFTTESFVQNHQKSVIDQSYTAVTLRDLVPSGPSIGLVADLARSPSLQYILAQGAYGFQVDRSRLHPAYLVWLSNYEPFRLYMKRHAVGSTQIHIRTPIFQDLEISLPPIAQQRRIAEILDRADAIRRKRQEAIRLTEELLRSAFLEMFGDPVTNPKGWTSGTILNVVTNPSDMRCGPFGTQLKAEEIVSEGIPLIGIENVKGGKFQSAISKHITSSKAKELAAFDVQAGDVLVTRMGTIGHACVVPQDLGEARISYHLFRIRSNPDKCLPGFLASTITWSGTFLRQLERLSHGAIMAGLKTADLKEVRFLIPPIKLQNQYLEVVADTERLLEKQKQRLMNDDNLFDSLLQRAFRGEL